MAVTVVDGMADGWTERMAEANHDADKRQPLKCRILSGKLPEGTQPITKARPRINNNAPSCGCRIKIFLFRDEGGYTPTMAPDAKLNCNIRASFATAFSNWRLKSKIPLKTIAKDLGLSIATISAWELGERFPTGRNFERLANYTGVPPCRLFCVMADKCVPSECLLTLPKRV